MPKAKVLLIDDEKAFTRGLGRLLAVRGYEVVEASDGDAALRALGDRDYDVTVLDLKMPGMDGIATLKNMKELGRLTETVILTGHGSSDARREANGLGAFAFLEKPCDLVALVDTIDAAMARKSRSEKRSTLGNMLRI
jgi:DNA-binding NtrC family response regulator